MADDVMAVDERLARLEVTVANGFSDLGRRMDRLEMRMDRLEDRVNALNSKLDVTAESLEGKMGLLMERMDAHAQEMRVWTKAIVDEHRADRRLMYAMLQDHGIRIRALEHDRASLSGSAPTPEG
jgi:uncharacterized coiled-coil protein SlyX